MGEAGEAWRSHPEFMMAGAVGQGHFLARLRREGAGENLIAQTLENFFQ